MQGLNLNKYLVIAVDVTCLLADVLPGQHFVAGLTLKTTQMPLPVQRQQSLSILYVSTTSCTVCKSKSSRT